MSMTRRTVIGVIPAVAVVAALPAQASPPSAFDLYVAEINRLAEQWGAVDPGKPYCYAEAWREMFDDGLTAAEAWQEECWAAASMLG